jgi:hypothetical protein
MARTAEPGISYYRMNCGHTRNKKVRLVFNEFDANGYWIWQCILDHAYDHRGYYFDYADKDALELFATDVCKKQVSLVEEVIAGCIRRGLFSKAVAESFGILTSVMMQEVYLDATKERRRKGTVIEIYQELLLAEVGEDPVNISIIPWNNEILPRKNEIIPGSNPQSRVENSKVKKSKEEKVAAPLAPPPKKLVKKVKEEGPVEPHWNLLVGIWFSFNKERLGEEPSFERDDPKVLKRIVQRLKKRAEKKNVPWTETTAPQRLKSFLEGAYAEDWISKHFLLANLERQFDIVIQKMAKKTNPGQAPATSKGSSESNRSEIQYLYERFCEGDLNEMLIHPDYYDRLVSFNCIPIGQLGKNGSASLPIEEQKKKGVLEYFKTQKESGGKLIL